MGYTPISQEQNVVKSTGQSMTAGVGYVVLKVEVRESMPNVVVGPTRQSALNAINLKHGAPRARGYGQMRV